MFVWENMQDYLDNSANDFEGLKVENSSNKPSLKVY